jgi:thioredoxin 1
MTYRTEQPTPEDVAAMSGAVVLEFGTNWCPICIGAQDAIREGLADADVTHIKAEDGRGRPLGRAFRVKLWPTLIFLRDGAEVGRVVRPTSAAEVSAGLAPLLSPG